MHDVLLVVLTYAYATFSRSFARKKPLLSTKTREVFLWLSYYAETCYYSY